MDTQPLVNTVKNVHHRNTSIATFRASLTELEKNPTFFRLFERPEKLQLRIICMYSAGFPAVSIKIGACRTLLLIS